MNLFDQTTYQFYRAGQNRKLKILIVSDVHFSFRLKNERLNKIYQKARELQPDYILSPGDLLDCNDMIDDPKEEKRLLKWLEKMGTIAPFILGLGNHDFYRRRPGTRDEWDVEFKDSFFAQVAALPGVHLLNDNSFEDKNLFVFGYTQSPDYFDFTYHSGEYSVFHPADENRPQMLKELKKLQPHFQNLPKNKLKIALIHSPVFLKDPEVTKYLTEFDYFVSGHMHNGVVPPVLNELWLSDRGFSAPGKKLGAKNTRRTIKTADDKLIVSGAVTTIHGSHMLHALNSAFPMFITLLEFSDDKSLARKPYHTHKYVL